MTAASRELSENLRQALAKQLVKEGAVSNIEWIAALNAVPREAFVPAYFHIVNEPDQPTRLVPSHRDVIDEEAWLREIYADKTLVTQLDGHRWPADVTDAVTAEPTSSSTMPSLVIWMLEELELADGHQVLEIGTGTGYSMALLCERLGAESVTSIEYDPEVARRAAAALHGLGYRPKLITGDGLAGDAGGGPFDRIIATCSVRAISKAWLEQARPGAIIVATLTGSNQGNALAKLTVTEQGTATGRVLPGTTSFMSARSQKIPLDPKVDLLDDVPDEPTELGPEFFDDWTGRFVAQLKAPYAVRTPLTTYQSEEFDYVVDQRDGSIAVLSQTSNGWQVRQAGPRRLWDEVTAVIKEWRAAGSPFMDQFLIHAEPDAYTVTIDGTNISWRTEPGTAIT